MCLHCQRHTWNQAVVLSAGSEKAGCRLRWTLLHDADVRYAVRIHLADHASCSLCSVEGLREPAVAAGHRG